VFIVFVLLILVVGCDDSSTDGVATSQCGVSASPAQLASKLDDDDGDGNPIDEDFPLIDDEDDDIADHAWIEDRSGTYHLFFHGENLYHPNQIEHYTTRDFLTLDYVGVALTVNPGAWDSESLWRRTSSNTTGPTSCSTPALAEAASMRYNASVSLLRPTW